MNTTLEEVVLNKSILIKYLSMVGRLQNEKNKGKHEYLLPLDLFTNVIKKTDKRFLW